MVMGKDGYMFLKCIGGFIVIIGCSIAGFRIAAEQRREERYLRTLFNLIEYMICELQCRFTPLPGLCNKTAEQTNCELKSVFNNLSNELESQVSPNAEICMNVAISCSRSIPDKTRECLETLGKTLGKFDIDGQIKGLEGVAMECKRKIEKLQNNADQRLRSYQTLGICAGAGLAIIFL